MELMSGEGWKAGLCIGSLGQIEKRIQKFNEWLKGKDHLKEAPTDETSTLKLNFNSDVYWILTADRDLCQTMELEFS
jgi:hypothetical protein